jgi:DNA mismatch repair protein MutS
VMEKHGGPLGKSASIQALPLFAATAPPEEATSSTDEIATLCDALKKLSLDNMSPKQALDALYYLKTLVPGCADRAK